MPDQAHLIARNRTPDFILTRWKYRIGPRPLVWDGIPVLLQPLPTTCVRPRKNRWVDFRVRSHVMIRDMACVVCGEELVIYDREKAQQIDSFSLELHHVRAFSLGGCAHPHNLVALCVACNAGIGVTDGGMPQ